MRAYKNLMLMLGFVFMLSNAMAQSEIYSESNAAIHGYDPVSYFKKSKPVKGNKQFSYKWKGANWLFENEENLKAFSAEPEKYAPQYGGYCAYGMSKGYKATTSPDAWSVVDGKLYLNYDTDVQKTWNKDQKNFIQKADKNWPTVKHSKE